MRVLVVDDEVRTAALLRRGLAEEGYAVDVAGDAREAIWRATEFGYDAVVLDVLLPEMDGFEVCRALRARGCWAPVLMLTARAAVQDRVRGLDAGADDYLTKPFSFSEARGVTVRLNAGERLPAVADAGRLRQAVDNLIDNAIRHAPAGSVVAVTGRGDPGPGRAGLVIEVRDQGPGFAGDFLPHAFERFRRAGAARSRADGGAGLGLAIVASIVRAHGGRVVADNLPERGARVRIDLPREPRADSGGGPQPHM
jgi:signal transduction histidine kinase